MKYQCKRHLILAAAVLITGTALGQTQVPNTFQSGQPAVAAEVNDNFTELESAANQNAGDIATNTADIAALDVSAAAAIGANSTSLAGLQSTMVNQELRLHGVENDLDLVLDLIIVCGEYRLYGCTQLTSADGTVFPRNWFAGGIYNVIYSRDTAAAVPADGVFFAVPIADEFDYQNLWIGGSANITRTHNPEWNSVLVDDCDNPTLQLVPSGEPVSTRLVSNNGNYYRAAIDPATGGYGPILNTVDVTGQTYGLINTQTPGNITEACTWVTDQTGMYDSYAIDLKFNVFDGRFDSPWTHQ